MEGEGEEANVRYCFDVTWFDQQAQLAREYQLLFYPADSSIEMYDVKQRRTFLKRSPSALRLEELYVGAALTIHARQLVVRGLGDAFTRARLTKRTERATLFIKPAHFPQCGQVLDACSSKGLTLANLRILRLGEGAGTAAREVLSKLAQPKDLEGTPGSCMALEFVGEEAQAALVALAGANPEGLTTATSLAASQELAKTVFAAGSPLPRTAQGKDCTVALVRPHAVVEGHSGAILTAILSAGFRLTDAHMVRMERANAEEFLEVYKGLLPEYHLMLDQMTSGPLIALEIAGPAGEDVVSTFRDFAGPHDPALAVTLRPTSIRARFGTDKVRNALYCTDLPEDGVLESQYFFKLLLA